MRELFITETRARLRTWLALGYALFIAYASLSPFTGWRKQGLNFADVLAVPLALTYTHFDAALNLLSYLPLGLLVALALRARVGALASVTLALAAGVLLSAGMEYLQMYLPRRISSNMDLLSNSTGTLIGALLAISIASWTRVFTLLVRWRSRLFHHGKEMDFGLALLVLWMFGQINPSLPMLGNVFISEVARQPFVALPPAPFDMWESVAVMLNLLMLGTLLLTLLRAPRNVVTALLLVLSIVALAKFVAAALLLKSWALLLWINGEAVLGILLGMLLLALLLWINGEAVLGILLGMLLLSALLWPPRAAMISLGASIAAGYFVIVNFLLGDSTPASAASIYHWHYGHLLNYNGLAQTISLLYPLLLLWHLWRIRKV
ncbi:MAG: teicoplanin resistance protein VanZ [Gallionellales bacterium GWA2_60_142]|nr:MAG: teicoplanin resistance protein VanZ [Gallionellales bacterium GWA2_60_142]